MSADGAAQTVDPASLLAIARGAAVEAGALLLEQARPWARGDLNVQSKSSATDAVTVMDLAAERCIVERITAERPDDAFLAEEGTQAARTRPSEGVTWIVDPLDGTVNFLYGLPHWAVSIAAEVDGAVVAGVVHVPSVGETFTAVRGAGAWLHTREERLPLRLGSTGPSLGHALVATGFGYQRERRLRQAAVVAALLPQVRDIRRLGAAAIDLCHVAAGRVDGFYELGLQPWDLAAGALLVTEAGGRVEGLNGAPPGVPFDAAGDPAGPGMVIAAGAALFPALHHALKGSDSGTVDPRTGALLPPEPTVP
jgi:myo-inositol-1(or 4)-monophosphatase